MTRLSHLTLVDDSYTEASPIASRRVLPSALSPENVADLEFIARHVLTTADLAIAELRNALANRDRDAALAAERRLLAVGLVAGDHARQMERDGSCA